MFTKVRARYVQRENFTDLDVCPPRLITSCHSSVLGVIKKIAIFTEAPPKAKLLASIVAFVDQVTLVRIGTVTIGKGFAGAVPSLGLEAVVVFQAQINALTQRVEEGGLVGGSPTEPGPLAMGGRVVTAGAGSRIAGALEGFWGAEVVVRHGADDGVLGGGKGSGSVRSCGPAGRNGSSRWRASAGKAV